MTADLGAKEILIAFSQQGMIGAILICADGFLNVTSVTLGSPSQTVRLRDTSGERPSHRGYNIVQTLPLPTRGRLNSAGIRNFRRRGMFALKSQGDQ